MEWSELSAEEQEKFMTSARTKIAPVRRPAWLPIVTDGDGDPRASKFSGTPLLAAGERWPECPNCQKPLQLFVQLDLATLPDELRGEFGEGVLQLFYCTTSEPLCEVDCEAYCPDALSVVARRLDSRTAIAAVRPIGEFFPAKTITSWERQADADYPNSEELEEIGISLAAGEREATWEMNTPLAGDKLAGWPNWIQGVEYPQCRECKKRMRLVFQIDSENNLPYMFGDCGIGHLTQCPDHKDVLAFGWACS